MIGVDTTFLVQLEIVEHPQHAAARATWQREVIDAGQLPELYVPCAKTTERDFFNDSAMSSLIHVLSAPHDPMTPATASPTKWVWLRTRESACRVIRRPPRGPVNLPD